MSMEVTLLPDFEVLFKWCFRYENFAELVK
jgi:hypothetical protein